jgi:polyvinyl alcohol dehydrogenase (cytochrome)
LLAVPLASAAPSSVLYSTEGNRLRRYDLDTVGNPPLVEDVLVERASAAETGSSVVGDFRDINGMICQLPDGSGRFIAGEDTGQPSTPPGWGVFTPGGVQVGKLTATYNGDLGDPYGCAFDASGNLFTTEIGDPGFLDQNGQLIMWFPPYDHFPGPPGAYPDTSEPSTNFCKIATDIGTATGVAIDPLGRVYVASSSGLSILRFSPPFPTAPNAAGGCGGTDALGSPVADVVDRETFVSLATFTGLAFAQNGNLYAASVVSGEIFEYDLDGNLVRTVVDPPESLPPISTGTPQGLAVGPDGTLYYADLDLVGDFPNLDAGPNGKVWRVRFDALGEPLPPEIIRQGLLFPDGVAVLPGEIEPLEWRTYAGGPRRLFFNPAESSLTAEGMGQLTVKWEFPTGAIITGSPSIARVSVPGEGRIPIAYIQSWDANLYALRVRDGSELWRFDTEEHPGVSYPNTGSVHVENVNGQERVYVGAGSTMYCIDALTGQEIWRFNAGTGCTDPPGLCAFDGERNQIESSPIVADGRVFFGMDVNDRAGGKGGFYGVDAMDGRLVWFFDLESGATCRPLPGDDIRKYDGYHSEAELGLPAGFFTTRPGCNHPRSPNGCGNVWSSPALDEPRGLLYTASSNCDTDNDPMTLEPPPPMPPYDEAVFALDLDGNPAWRWRPREVDNDDLAFGAVPNLFTVMIDGAPRDVVGLGNKDGTYYLLDRDGENEITGVRWDDVDPSALPYWSTQVVPGGDPGGVMATAAVDEQAGRIYFGSGPGPGGPFDPQRPTVHALSAPTGAVIWENTGEVNADASFAPTSAVPGVVFAGAVIGGNLRSYDATNGDKVGSASVGIAVACAPVVVDGLVLVGGGIGERNGNPASPAEISSNVPHDVTALCLPGTRACATDVRISADTLRVLDPPSPGQKTRLRFVSKDPAIVPPAAASDGDPTVVGATLRILNADSGEEQEVVLPASSWEAGGSPGDERYGFRGGKTGSFCKSVRVKRGRIRANCRGETAQLTLDEPQQGALVVALHLGNDVTYCTRLGGVLRDVSGLFIAKDAPAPATCPLR